MKCEYCGTVFKDDEVSGTCPNCGGVFPEASNHKQTVASPFEMADEQKRQKLQQSGCRYCPRCLSTNVSKRRLFSSPRALFFFLFTCALTTIAMWLIVVPIFVLLINWMLSGFLRCEDCKQEWIPSQARVYEKYRFPLYRCMGSHPAVQCPGINQQMITMNIHTVTIAHPPKQTAVRYDQLASVAHREPAGDLFGYLTIRNRSNKDLPVPKSYEEAQKDRMTILYEPEYTGYYQSVYYALKEIAEENTKNP